MDGDRGAGLGGAAREAPTCLGGATREPPAGLGDAAREGPVGLGSAPSAAPAGLGATPKEGPAGLGGAPRVAPADLATAPRAAAAGLGSASRAAPAGLGGTPRGGPAILGNAIGVTREAPASLGGAARGGLAQAGACGLSIASGMEQDPSRGDFGGQDDGDQGLDVGGRGRDCVGNFRGDGQGRGRVGQGGGRGHGCGAGHGSEKASKRNAPDTGDSIEWTDANTTIICSLFAKQVKKGNRPNTHLNSVGYDEVSNEFFNLTAIRLTKRQMKNKWDKLKIDLMTWKKLMRKQTGAGWDRARGVIDMDDEWWKKVAASFEKIRCKMRRTIMFADITNDESDYWNTMSSNPIIPPTQEDVDNRHVNEVHDVPDDCDHDGVAWDETDEVQEVTPSPTILLANKRIPPAKKQRTGTAQVIQEQVTKIAESTSSFTSKKLGEVTVQQVMDLVLECGAGYDTDEHYIAIELFVKKDQKDMFMTLPTNEIRFNWLPRKYNVKYGN
ncbi:L10-interacting MYB domain-containing protein-like [Setaria italica]|uniref:L10-interacting MYB domain-containing protein-like n=1 Tax=Setaria italica TaxID=4555 RepID=UPI000BE6099C|nr:L10-interacting MYB domain-containing protein-like [Setaria italica]